MRKKNKFVYDLVCYCDGVSKNNPGEAGIGVVIMNGEYKILNKISEYIGIATNNIAEYSALINALKTALKLKANNILIYTDSELVVKQIKGEYLTKNANLMVLRNEVLDLIKQFFKCNIVHISRENNKLADKLANLGVKYKEAGL